MLFVTAIVAGCSTPYPASKGPVLREADGSGVSPDTADSAQTEDSAGVPPCVAYAETVQTGTVTDASLNEISGVAASRRNPGALWVMEDHAGPNQVHAIDATGEVVARVVLEGVVNNDWEDLAVGPCGETTCLFVGDIGDNDHDRPWHGVLRFEEPDLSAAGVEELSVAPDIFPYVFPEGQSWDSEALAVQPEGLPVLFTKEYETQSTAAFSFPLLDTAQVVTLNERGRTATGEEGEGSRAATTAADLWPDGSRLILRTYAHIWEFVLTADGLDDLDAALRVERFTGTERQGEAIGYDPFSPGYYTISEDLNPPVYRTNCSD